MPEKQTNQKRLKEITERIEAGIRDILDSGDIQKYQEYLRTMSRFHRYSVNNQMLIHLQCPNATLVAGYSKWEKQFSRHVMQGEKGITIIAPTPYKKKIEQEKLDPDTKLPLLDENGDVIVEEKEIKIPMFRPVKVFDYSQTDGKPLPEHVASPVAALTGDVENYEVFMEALRRSSPVPIQIKPLSSDLDGFFSPDTQSITLREGMSQVQTVCAAVHELAHARLHNYKKPEVLPDGVERGTAKSRNTEEVEAESISFMVCAYFGIETSGNSFGYVASWSKDATIPEFRASLDTIGKTANAIITDVETHFPVICKERGIELPHEKDTAQPEQEASAAAPQDQPAQPEVSRAVEEAPPEAVPEIAAPPDPGMSIAAMNAFGYTDADMLPLSKERALELLERDIPVYMLMEDNAEAMAFEPEDIEMHTGMFGITRQDWESVRDSVPPMDNAVIQERREQAFLNNPAASYAIFQLKSGEEQRLLRFENTDYLQKHGLHPEKGNYELVYTGTLPDGGSSMERLEGLYQRFNMNRPEDFYGHSLSVSDIIAIKERGVVSSHYLDSVGYEANTEARKKELFAKVRSGQVRVLMGSTFKMGAGMNVQDRLVALHDLDCPWRPGDLEQRSGRIIRQGNRNKEVHIYRYVTESTFDAYLWQTVENKQKFISQIMTSKSPVRSCEDIDETALSYAEIKALCAGDERIKEKMDLDVDVARLKLMKANHQSQQYRLEDNILRYFPEQIEQAKGIISGLEADMKTLEQHPHPKDGFAGMEVKGDLLTDKDNAGAAILEAFKDAKGLEPVPIGSYRGFAILSS